MAARPGVDAIRLNRRDVIAGSLVFPTHSSKVLAAQAEQGLHALAKQRGLFYGCAVKSKVLATDTAFAVAVAGEAGILVPEYELKRGTVQPRSAAYDFTGGDALLTFALANGMMMRGHALVWYYGNPHWLTQRLQERPDERLITDYVADVVGHYKGQLQSWDVVNEAIEPRQDGPGGLRIESPWYQAFGDRHIELAFHAAREADHTAQLFYNEYNTEMANHHHSSRRRAALKLLEKLLARGVPVDGFGIQAHLKLYGQEFNEELFAAFLAEISGMGLKIMVTEFDIADIGGPVDIGQRDADAAVLARRFLDAVLANPAATGVLTWGLSDRYSWLSDYADYRWPDGQLSRGLPLDSEMMRKPMWCQMSECFRVS